jgi:hypothetical protein
LITLTFRPLRSESPVLVRGTYFRICADATLRGPDNAVVATYADGLWQLSNRQHRGFECGGPVYLRVTHTYGRREHIGPYEFLKAAEGAIFTHESRLGVHAARGEPGAWVDLWKEIAFLTAV